MRENRTHGSEGGEAHTFPTPINRQGGGMRFAGAKSCGAGDDLKTAVNFVFLRSPSP